MKRPAGPTFDTNVLVYTVQPGDPRRDAARELLRLGVRAGCRLPFQAFGEFFAASTRKRLLTVGEAAAQLRRWLELFPDPLPVTEAALRAALAAAEEGRFSYWDALLLAAAAEAGCEAVISEDMGHGARLGAVRVVRAFDGAAISAEARALLG